MSFSRLSVLAVFLMMVMSAFVAMSTYNVGADEHDGEEEGCPFDWDDPDSPCNADECQDHESQECQDYVESYCESNDDPGCYEGGDDEGPVPESFHVTAEMNTLEEWTITFGADMPTDWSDEMREDLAGMCAELGGENDGERITEECFNHWIEMIESDDGGGDENGCPPGLSDEQCDALEDCFENNDGGPILDCWRMLYDICADDGNYEFCYMDEHEARHIFNNIFAYEDGDIGPEDLMEAIIDVYGDGTGDYTEMAAYDIQSFTIGEEDAGTYGIYPEFLSSESPNFVCGNGEEMPFVWVNDGYEDCGDGSDEQQYDDDGNEINWFDCHDGSEVWVHQVNDEEWNCPDGEDEYQFNYWYGNVYMYSGIVEDPEDLSNLIGGIGYQCGWSDEHEVEIFCNTYWEADLSAGDYSILTTGSCHDEWTDDDEDGEDDSHELSCEHGDYNHTVVDSDGNPVTYFAGSVVETLMMEIGSAHYDSIDHDKGNFPLYDTYELTVGEGGFNGAITSAQWECYGDGENDYCDGADLALYLYEYSFNPDDPYDNILGANDYADDEDLDCPVDDCSHSRLEVELSEGTYVVVTAGYSTHNSGFYANDIVNRDGDILESWDGELLGSYWDSDETRVQGDDRAYIPYTYEFEKGDDPFWNLYMDILDTIGSYKDGTSAPLEAADRMIELVYQADAMGLYNEGEGEDDCYDEDGNQVGCSDDGDECPFSDNDFCYEIGPYCDPESGDYDPAYCGAESAHYCLEDGANDEGCADIDELVADCDAGEAPQEICDAFLNFDHDAYHADHDDDDHARLDGIIGVEDPPNNDPDISPTNLVGALSDNEGLPMMYSGQFTLTFEGADGSLDMHEFYIPIDDGTWNVEMILLDGYEALSCDGCDSFEVTETGALLSSGAPVTVTFGKAAPGPDCDYVVGIDSTGYAFDPVELTINVGETVCWQWADTSDAHNVVEINAEYDIEMNVADVSVGFTSGDVSNNMDFRHTFTEDDKTHYYVCEPHAAMGMVGKITVGEGTPDDPVKEIEESGLPSVGFIVGALVLVGAAGLRRRIH